MSTKYICIDCEKGSFNMKDLCLILYILWNVGQWYCFEKTQLLESLEVDLFEAMCWIVQQYLMNQGYLSTCHLTQKNLGQQYNDIILAMNWHDKQDKQRGKKFISAELNDAAYNVEQRNLNDIYVENKEEDIVSDVHYKNVK